MVRTFQILIYLVIVGLGNVWIGISQLKPKSIHHDYEGDHLVQQGGRKQIFDGGWEGATVNSEK